MPRIYLVFTQTPVDIHDSGLMYGDNRVLLYATTHHVRALVFKDKYLNETKNSCWIEEVDDD
jgi:hypothetical protein